MEARALPIVAQRYALHERVGQGGCGVVYRATDQTTGATVAVKMLLRAARQNPSLVERLVREQQALLALAGTHAVAAIDLCRADTGELCLVMEWLEGADLEQHLVTREQLGTRFSSDELLHVMQPVLETLAKAHELGIVHRDVKPANIFLLSENRGVRLLDFGFSRLKTSATLTAADTVMGSPSYIAPEAWLEGSKAIGKQADLYAAGVIVFRALAGQVPFEGSSLVKTMQLVTTAPRPRLSELRPELPKVMDEWLEVALAVDPERRFQHAQSFLEALSAALSGVDLPRHTLPTEAAHALPPPPPKTTPGERHNALSTALGRAASLLKRVASSFSRAPTPASALTPDTPPPKAQQTDSPGLPPPPRSTPSRVRAKPALPPLVRPRGSGSSSAALPVASSVIAVNESATGAADRSPSAREMPSSLPPDLLIAELLPPSMPPPAPLDPTPPVLAPVLPPAASATLEPPVLAPDLPPEASKTPEPPVAPKASKPRTRKRSAPATQHSSAEAPKRASAKTGNAKTKVRKAVGKATPAPTATKKAAPVTKAAPKQTPARKALKKATSSAKPKAGKQQTRAVAATAPRAAQAGTGSPKRPRTPKSTSRRTRDKAVNPAMRTVDQVDKLLETNKDTSRTKKPLDNK